MVGGNPRGAKPPGAEPGPVGEADSPRSLPRSVGALRAQEEIAPPLDRTREGQAVMTSWALLALAAAGRGGSEEALRGVRFLEGRQRPDGSFPPEHIAGMFNKTCAIHYDNYLKVFPLWALAATAPVL